MSFRKWIFELGLTAGVVSAAILFSSLRRPPESSAVPAKRVEVHADVLWPRLTKAAREAERLLVSQPDVERAEVLLFTPEGRPLLVLVSLVWTGNVPPPARLEGIAHWMRARFAPEIRCAVHVVDEPDRRFVLEADAPNRTSAIPRMAHE